MISVLILDGFSDEAICINGTQLSEVCNIYIPLLEGMLRYNGIMCETVKTHGLEHEYGICGKNRDNIIYVPVFSYADSSSSGISFIYTDSTAADSPSFRIASVLREKRSEKGNQVVFVNALHENDPFRSNSPIIVDNMRFDVNNACHMQNIYRSAIVAAESICEYYCREFRDPANST